MGPALIRAAGRRRDRGSRGSSQCLRHHAPRRGERFEREGDGLTKVAAVQRIEGLVGGRGHFGVHHLVTAAPSVRGAERDDVIPTAARSSKQGALKPNAITKQKKRNDSVASSHRRGLSVLEEVSSKHLSR